MLYQGSRQGFVQLLNQDTGYEEGIKYSTVLYCTHLLLIPTPREVEYLSTNCFVYIDETLYP